MNTKNKTIALLMAAIVVSAVVVPMVMAQQYIQTEGVVTGSGTPPIIKAKWELPDDADAPSHNVAGTQVLPEVNGNKRVEFYMVARDPNGAGDIVNAGFRVEHPAEPDIGTACWMPNPVPAIYGYGMVDSLIATEWVYGTVQSPGAERAAIEAAIAAAVNVQLITQLVADDLLEELEQQEARFYYAEEDFTCCWAPGVYSVMAWASDTAGGQGELTNDLYYESIIAIDLDFSAGINYGDLVPGIKQILSGNEVFNDGDGAPTVISLANDPIEIWLRADAMEGVFKHQFITNFDARLNHDTSIDFVAGVDTVVPGVLIPNWLEKMDFSVTPPDGTPADTYIGTMTLWIEHYYCCC